LGFFFVVCIWFGIRSENKLSYTFCGICNMWRNQNLITFCGIFQFQTVWIALRIQTSNNNYIYLLWCMCTLKYILLFIVVMFVSGLSNADNDSLLGAHPIQQKGYVVCFKWLFVVYRLYHLLSMLYQDFSRYVRFFKSWSWKWPARYGENGLEWFLS